MPLADAPSQGHFLISENPMKTGKTNPPRNHVFVAMIKSRKPGAHTASKKSARQQGLQQLRRSLKNEGIYPMHAA